MIKQRQGDFESTLKNQLEANAFAQKLNAAANRYCTKQFGSDHYSSPGVAGEIVQRFGIGDKSVRCMEYVLEQTRTANVVSPTYTSLEAIRAVWAELQKALDAGTEFNFTQEPNADFRAHLQLVK